MKTVVFPGQGSQKKGMGKTLFDDFKDLTSKADNILGYSIKELCLEDPNNSLGQTDYTQPALYVVNALTWLQKIKSGSERPNFTAGHSLGEYNALLASGAFDFETGLKLVKERGRLMALAKNGAMAAVIGLKPEKIENILLENQFKNLSIANYNSTSQIVITGPSEDIHRAEPTFTQAQARLYLPLRVSGAFHSKYMKNAANEFGGFIDKFEFRKLDIPVISNATGRPYDNNIKELLIKQIISPVQWMDSIRYLMGRRDMEFEEVGPGKILTGLIRDIKSNAAPIL